MWMTMDGKEYWFDKSEVEYEGQSRKPLEDTPHHVVYRAKKRVNVYINYRIK